jgi:hypothetical protein
MLLGCTEDALDLKTGKKNRGAPGLIAGSPELLRESPRRLNGKAGIFHYPLQVGLDRVAASSEGHGWPALEEHAADFALQRGDRIGQRRL